MVKLVLNAPIGIAAGAGADVIVGELCTFNSSIISLSLLMSSFFVFVSLVVLARSRAGGGLANILLISQSLSFSTDADEG